MGLFDGMQTKKGDRARDPRTLKSFGKVYTGGLAELAPPGRKRTFGETSGTSLGVAKGGRDDCGWSTIVFSSDPSRGALTYTTAPGGGVASRLQGFIPS